MDFEDEPMDVDLSANSIRHIDAMDISYNDSNQSSLDIKIKEEPIETNNEELQKNIFVTESNIVRSPLFIKRYSLQRKDHKSLSNTTLSVIFFIVSLLTLLMYYIIKFECSKEFDTQLLKKSLTKNIIGQSHAIEHIIESLEEKSSSKLLLFYGGTGVGKTLTISLILENLHHYANIYHYTMPTFYDIFSADMMLGITFCPTSLIVVDDLYNIDLQLNEHIKKIIEKSENLNKNITIILVFNCDIVHTPYVNKCDNTFTTNLQMAFKEIKALKRLIMFNSLTEDHLQKCIQRELGDTILTEEEFKNVTKNFNVTVDGCKGVYTKIKMLNMN